jgi:hypothetical protein
MNWRTLFRQGTQAPSAQEPEHPESPKPETNDPYAEKRRRAVELLGERYILHPTKTLHLVPGESGGLRPMRGMQH